MLSPSKKARLHDFHILSDDERSDAGNGRDTRHAHCRVHDGEDGSRSRLDKTLSFFEQLQEDEFSDLKADLRAELDRLHRLGKDDASDSTKVDRDSVDDVARDLADVLQSWVGQACQYRLLRTRCSGF
jgi:hypothetical protein